MSLGDVWSRGQALVESQADVFVSLPHGAVFFVVCLDGLNGLSVVVHRQINHFKSFEGDLLQHVVVNFLGSGILLQVSLLVLSAKALHLFLFKLTLEGLEFPQELPSYDRLQNQEVFEFDGAIQLSIEGFVGLEIDFQLLGGGQGLFSVVVFVECPQVLKHYSNYLIRGNMQNGPSALASLFNRKKPEAAKQIKRNLRHDLSGASDKQVSNDQPTSIQI